MQMKNPPHPGRLVRDDCLAVLDLTLDQAAEALGVSHDALSEVVNGRAGISPDMAIRFSKAFGGSADVWVRMQKAYDRAQAGRP